MIVGAGGVYAKLFAVFHSSVKPEVTIGQPEGSQGRKLDLDESRNRLGICRTNWNS